MNKEKLPKPHKKNDLATSKIILCKLIKHYSYDSIVNYLIDPNKIDNPKLEIIMKKLINKIGVDTLAFLLCNDNLNSENVNNEKEEEKTLMKSYDEIEKEHLKIKNTTAIKKRYKNRIKIINKDNNKKEYYKYPKYKYKHKKIKNFYISGKKKDIENYFNNEINNSSYISSNYNQVNEDSRSDDNSSNSSNSNSKDYSDSNSNNNSSIKDNNNYNSNLTDFNDFSEFYDSNINNEDIINLVNEMEEDDESETKKEEKKIILDETNSYVNKIIYKEPINSEIYYYCYESLNSDNTINMKCIDEKCKSKGVYNSTKKQIIISVEHTIIYEDHCYLKPNFGGDELKLEIFDFIKDNPDIKGIEILKSKEKYEKNKAKKNENKIKIKQEHIDDNLNIESDDEDLNKESENNIDDQNKENDDNDKKDLEEEEMEPLFQNRISNNITQIIQKDKNKKSKSQKIDDREKFTLINLDINNYFNTNVLKKNNPRRISKSKDIKGIDFITKKSKSRSNCTLYKTKNIYEKDKEKEKEKEKEKDKEKEIIKEKVEEKEKEKEEDIDEINTKNVYNCSNLNIVDSTKDVPEEKEKDKEKDINNKEENESTKKENENENENEKKIEQNDLNEENIDEKNKDENEYSDDDNGYNFVEFNIEKIKKLEGTENSYSKKVYEINLENKKNVEEENKLNNKANNTNRKSEEKVNENYYTRSRSRSRSPSYLMINEKDNESQVSQLSVISHFKNKNKEEKIIIEENDSFFSSELLAQKDKEKYNKKLNDETILLSDDSEKRKRLERIQKKYQERQLKKYLKKNKYKKLFFKVNERIIRDEDEEVTNKRRIFGIIRKSYLSILENNSTEENKDIDINKEKNNLDDNNDKKRHPIFGIYNPNKHNPKFFVDNNFNKK